MLYSSDVALLRYPRPVQVFAVFVSQTPAISCSVVELERLGRFGHYSVVFQPVILVILTQASLHDQSVSKTRARSLAWCARRSGGSGLSGGSSIALPLGGERLPIG